MILSDGMTFFARVLDRVSRSLRSIDARHAAAHAGLAFSKNFKFTSVADAGSSEILLQTGAKIAHMHIDSRQIGNYDLDVYIDTIVTDVGAATADPVNFNDNSSNPSTLTFTTGPTISDDGTLKDFEFVPAGTGGLADQGISTDEFEYVMKPNTKYLVRKTNHSGQARDQFIRFKWYEGTRLIT